jgi:hypothetical protein
LINTYVYFYILIVSTALQCFFHIQKGKVVMRKILRPLFVTMLVASCGGGAGTNPFDSREQTTSEATGEVQQIKLTHLTETRITLTHLTEIQMSQLVTETPRMLAVLEQTVQEEAYHQQRLMAQHRPTAPQ